MAKTLKTKAKAAKKPAAVKTVAKTKKAAPVIAKKVVAKKAVAKAPVVKAKVKPVAKSVAKPVAKSVAKAVAKPIAAPKKVEMKKQPEAAVIKKEKVQKKEAAPVIVQETVIVKKIEKLDFVAGDFVVYPAHGVGLVEGVETQTIAGMEITLYTICFEKDRMRLKLPVSKVKASGLRKLSSKDRLKDALATLQGRSQTRRIMWSRRAQEYETKINSGDPVAIAEVLRDLRKADDQSEQSYSERQIYQAALERLAREVAAIERIDEKKAAEKLEEVLTNVA